MSNFSARITREAQRLNAYLFSGRTHNRNRSSTAWRCLLRTCRHCQFRPRPKSQFRPAFLIRGATRDKLVLELPDKTLHWPRASFSERANRPATGDVVRNPDQVVRVALAPFAMSQTMQGFGHPQRTFAARGALAAAFVRVKLRDIRERLDDVRRIVEHNDGAGAGHAAGRDEGIKIVRQIEQTQLLLGLFAIRSSRLEFEFLAGFENLCRGTAGNHGFQFPSVAQASPKGGVEDEFANGDFANFDFIITGFFDVAAEADDAGAGVVR